jgi:flagellar L-ring protein precursor FlgH
MLTFLVAYLLLPALIEVPGEMDGTRKSGSLYSDAGILSDLARDSRAFRIDDIVTVVVVDRASASSRGATATARKSDARASLKAMGGLTRIPGPWPSMLDLSADRKLDGQGETSRESDLRTTVTARVVGVLPGGNLRIEGRKGIRINSENQTVTLRGVIRTPDIGPGNRVSSERIADLAVEMDGKGVINDAIRRPNFLYRLLLGVLPF